MPAYKKNNIRFKFPEFLFVLLIVLSGTMLAFSSGSFIVNFSRIGFTVTSTIEKGLSAIVFSITRTVNAVEETANLRQENSLLKQKLEDYEFMQRNNTEIRAENDRLKKLLDFSEQQVQKNYAARIISRDADSLYTSLTIDKGSLKGIRKNMPVIAIQNGNIGVVGKVIKVGRYTSMVMPLYDLHCNISARVKNTRDLGLVSGLGAADNPLEMRYIKKRVLDELHFGDVIVTSGENDNYAKDIPIGTISKITVQNYDSSLNIEIVPVVDFSRLETVLVVNMNKQNGE
jgi:rod shape-determining protein MreC